MLEVGGDLDLGEEALRAEDRCQFGAQDFHGHLALVLQVPGDVDRSHPTATDLTFDRVTVGECSFQSLLLVHAR